MSSAPVAAIATNSLTWIGTRALDRPGISRKQPPMRQKARNAAMTTPCQRGVHEIVPSTRISTPLAISTCDSTGSVGNSRSMIMRT